jgi:hypothetical protein
MRLPGRRVAASERCAVDQVVVDEARHVHELDRDAGLQRRLAVRREEDDQRAKALPARRQCRGTGLRDGPWMTRDGRA